MENGRLFFVTVYISRLCLTILVHFDQIDSPSLAPRVGKLFSGVRAKLRPYYIDFVQD